MPVTGRKRKRTFLARTDDGETVEIYHFADVITTPTRGRTYVREGMATLETADGEHVNWIAKGVYETLDGERLTSDDPAAP